MRWGGRRVALSAETGWNADGGDSASGAHDRPRSGGDDRRHLIRGYDHAGVESHVEPADRLDLGVQVDVRGIERHAARTDSWHAAEARGLNDRTVDVDRGAWREQLRVEIPGDVLAGGDRDLAGPRVLVLVVDRVAGVHRNVARIGGKLEDDPAGLVVDVAGERDGAGRGLRRVVVGQRHGSLPRTVIEVEVVVAGSPADRRERVVHAEPHERRAEVKTAIKRSRYDATWPGGRGRKDKGRLYARGGADAAVGISGSRRRCRLQVRDRVDDRRVDSVGRSRHWVGRPENPYGIGVCGTLSQGNRSRNRLGDLGVAQRAG